MEQAGVSLTKYAVEKVTPAANSFRANKKHAHVFNDDINDLLKRMLKKEIGTPQPGDIDMVLGGPPCQGFSGLNRFADRSTGEVSFFPESDC